MRALPIRPLKNVVVVREDTDRYRITIKSRVDSEADFRKIVRDDFAVCLGRYDALVSPDWPSRSVIVVSADFAAFKQKLIYRFYLVREAQERSQ